MGSSLFWMQTSCKKFRNSRQLGDKAHHHFDVNSPMISRKIGTFLFFSSSSTNLFVQFLRRIQSHYVIQWKMTSNCSIERVLMCWHTCECREFVSSCFRSTQHILLPLVHVTLIVRKIDWYSSEVCTCVWQSCWSEQCVSAYEYIVAA